MEQEMLLSEHEKSTTLTEEQLRRVALACFVNTQALYEDACLLANHARYPRAAALAVIGGEEFVKSVAYTIAALNPHERVRLPQKRKALSHHDIKHGSADHIEGVVI
jgi:AbiV family abortive infection protein